MAVEFLPWPKTPRLFRNITVTEKIDGTNACIRFIPISVAEAEITKGLVIFAGDGPGEDLYLVVAQSRKRIITPESDNFGFARWVHENAGTLFHILGPGTHFGEWWGAGIQRNYGYRDGARIFSLFNTDAWYKTGPDGYDSMATRVELSSLAGQVRAVPVLYQGSFSQEDISLALEDLQDRGSYAAPGFKPPEGICVWHSASRQVFKVTLDNQDAGKWEVA